MKILIKGFNRSTWSILQSLRLIVLVFSLNQAVGQCVVPVSFTLTYQSTSGSNCTFRFRPTTTVNSPGGIKLAEYTFASGATSVRVCYTGTPVVIVPCTGTFSSIVIGQNQLFPAATVTLPCNITANGTLTLRGSTATSGQSTCSNQTLATDTALPVNLVSFSGASRPGGVQLNWVTGWELDTDGFDVQRSTNAQSFEQIGFVKAQATGQRPTTYTFQDNAAQGGETYYYKLRIRDIHGATEPSKIIAVRHSDSIEMAASVFPNANKGGNFTLSMPDARTSSVKLYTLDGVELPIATTTTDNPNLLSIASKNSLSAGIYLLRVYNLYTTANQLIKVAVE